MIICVTGPIAAGKNAAAAILEKKEFAVVDADELVRMVLKTRRVTDRIISAFSVPAAERHIVLVRSDGTLDRKALGSLVFSDRSLLAIQEAIVYPELTKLLTRFITEKKRRNIVINAAVLYKIPELLQYCDVVLFIDAPAFIRFCRVKRRDQMKTGQILCRFRAQAKLFAKYKKSTADIKRVWNTGSLTRLEQKIDLFLLKCRRQGC